MRTTVRMPDALAAEVSDLAQKTSRTFTELVEEAMLDLLHKHRAPRRRKRIVLPVMSGNGRSISAGELKAAIAETALEDDIHSISPTRHAASRR